MVIPHRYKFNLSDVRALDGEGLNMKITKSLNRSLFVPESKEECRMIDCCDCINDSDTDHMCEVFKAFN